MKVFISYATEDLPTANIVFREMEAARAEVFQFGRSEIFGKPSWEQVLEWITQSDVFIVLISRHSLKSKPVREEIEQANYSYINRGRPEKLVPALIESGAAPPILIERFTQIDFTDLEAGLDRLIKQLNLVRRDKPIAASAALPDVGPLFADFKRRHPVLLPANLFSAEADKVLANYNKLAPKTIGASDRKQQVDGILAGLSGKKIDSPNLSSFTAMFPAQDRESGSMHKTSHATESQLARPQAKIKFFDWKLPLETPEPTIEAGATIVWKPVPGAASYEVSPEPPTGDSVYRCTEPRYKPMFSLVPKQYRVRAIGHVFFSDSAWSQTVSVGGVIPNLRSGLSTLDLARVPLPYAPLLEISRADLLTNTLRWSCSMTLAKYVLQRSVDPAFIDPETAYEGFATEWTSEASLVPVKRYCRVKAVSALGDETQWSNVVECK